MPKTTSGVDVGTGTGMESGVNFSLLLKGAIALIVILAVGFIVTSSLSGNDIEGKDQKIPDKTDIDPVSGGVPVAGGVAGAGIVAGEEVSGEVGYIEKFYPIDSVPPVLVPRDDNYTINSIAKNIEQQNNLKYEKLKATISYIKNTKTCRNIQLLHYFNETITEPCGKCDVCRAKISPENPIETISNYILNLLKKQPLSSQELTTGSNYSESEILNSLKILLEKNKITITSQNKFKPNF